MWGMKGKHHIIHTCIIYIYECIYIYIYIYAASPVTVYVSTDLFSVRGKRKGVGQPRSARDVLEDLGKGRQHSHAHNEVICINK